MKISGFTLVRNGDRFDYPYLESIVSLLPIVDELVINVGIGDDQTLQKIRLLEKQYPQKKFVIFESHWPLDDPEKKKGGRILSEETNKALDMCTGEWCLYLQADEVLHEKDYSSLRAAFKKYQDNPRVEGLLFDYTHFYGSYDIIQYTRKAYRREVRAIKKFTGLRSVGDAQSFRHPGGEKPQVARSGANVYHYGWVRTPEAMKSKTFFMDQLYHGTPSEENAQSQTPHTGDNYRYRRFWGLQPFQGTHPSTMTERVRAKNWHWDFKNSHLSLKRSDLKNVVLDSLEKLTGHRFFEYRSYRLFKD